MPDDQKVLLDLNNVIFQEGLFALPKDEKVAVLNTLRKIRSMTWRDVYRDKGLRWEKIASVKPPSGIPAIYSLRATRSCRATAFREGGFMRFLTITADHDAAYGGK
ncbi:MAG: hypothetical protein K6G15_05735 [Desulfovibrio sp.]|nr:hypothetical protein [Desulfovibrio sp.]